MPVGDNELVVSYLLTKGVTKCPTVVLTKSKQVTNKLSSNERTILRKHQEEQSISQDAKWKKSFDRRQFYFLLGFLFLPISLILSWLS